MHKKKVAIVGGYGVVGAEIARMIRRRYPDVELLIIGRDQAKASKLASELGKASGIEASLQEITETLLLDLNADLVVAAVGDPQRKLLTATLSAEVPYLDFAVAGQPIVDAVNISLQSGAKTPVALISNWMAGVPAILASALVAKFDEVHDVEIDILYYGNDRGGPDTADAVSDFARPFLAMRDGVWRKVLPMREPKKVEFLSGKRRTTAATNVPDLQTVAYSSRAKNVYVRLGLENQAEWSLMRFIVISRIWSLFPESLKKSIMYNPGEGDSHEIVVSVRGSKQGSVTEERIKLLDKAGQVHLTAVGVVHAIERLLGLGYADPVSVQGPAFPEVIGDRASLLSLLEAEDVQVTE